MPRLRDLFFFAKLLSSASRREELRRLYGRQAAGTWKPGLVVLRGPYGRQRRLELYDRTDELRLVRVLDYMEKLRADGSISAPLTSNVHTEIDHGSESTRHDTAS